MLQPLHGEIWVGITCDILKYNCKSCNASTLFTNFLLKVKFYRLFDELSVNIYTYISFL